MAGSSLARRGALAPWVIGLGVALLGVGPVPGNTWGYERVVAAIPVRPNLVTLIAADEFGEGAFVAERLMKDRAQQGVVLRATKALVSSDWSGTYYTLKKPDADSIEEYLNRVPVQYIVIDKYVRPGRAIEPHRTLLLRTIEERPDQFRRVESFPLIRRGVTFPNTITVYENLAADREVFPDVELEMSHSLRRTIRLLPKH